MQIYFCVTICIALSSTAVGNCLLFRGQDSSSALLRGLPVVLSASHLCLADSAPIQRHSLPGKSFPVSFYALLEREQGSTQMPDVMMSVSLLCASASLAVKWEKSLFH